MISKENNVSKAKLAQQQLIELIKSSDFSIGDKLPSERELAAELNVSRNILREAIVSLSVAGIIEVRERQGIFIKSTQEYGEVNTLQGLQLMPADFFSYQLETRTIIEVSAVKLATQRRTDIDIQKLRDCYANFSECPYQTPEEQSQNGKWEALLHSMYINAAHNPILTRINESINVLVERNNTLLHPILIFTGGWLEHIKEQHRTIIGAIESQDPKLAGNVLEMHLVESVQIISAKCPGRIAKLTSPYWSL